MKMGFLISLVLLVCAAGTSAWGVCPEDANDLGACDSMYVEPWPADSAGAVPHSVRVPIYVKHDVSNETIDSIAGMTFTLCYTHTKQAQYCSLNTYWNSSATVANSSRNIFRHLVVGTDTTHNWMLRQKELGEALDEPENWVWATIILDLDGTSHFWLLLAASTQPLFGENGKKTLIATMTFRVQNTDTICIDTCFWPPFSRLQFARIGAEPWIPRMGTPHDPSSYNTCIKFRDVKEIRGADDELRPSQFHLSQNYPNPFNPVTNFQFTLSKSGHVKIDIFNIVGQRVRTLVDKDMKPGVYVADWDGKDENGYSVSSGIYFYRMQAGEFSNMKKMVLLK
jgi:hypothetical protein